MSSKIPSTFGLAFSQVKAQAESSDVPAFDPIAERRGSLWRRWDPHIHAPGTIRNDQFKGPDSWDRYLDLIEKSEPRIEVLGVTDYASLDLYEKVRAFKGEGRLPDVSLIFANVELRYNTLTKAGSALNFHLLFSPEDENHVEEAKRFLGRLKMNFQEDEFSCSRSELVRLGRMHSELEIDEEAALALGVDQFKVAPSDLAQALKANQWSSRNVLVALVAGSNDGVSGLKDGSMKSVRNEIERLSTVVFSANPADREFWLGLSKDSVDRIKSKYGGLKPCVHGSDAHRHEDVGKPTDDRYTWIKGDATFESLRQACMDPACRAFVGKAPPSGALSSQTVTELEVTGTAWWPSGPIPLNSGLVGVIGPRGSGKTALADLLALGAGVDVEAIPETFLERAGRRAQGAKVQLEWGDESFSQGTVGAVDENDRPRVQYLSQKFVERLCDSRDGLSDELLKEVQRVVFEALPPENQEGAADFDELFEIISRPARRLRERHEQMLETSSREQSEEQRKIDSQGELKKELAEKQKQGNNDEAFKKQLLEYELQDVSGRLSEISDAAASRSREIGLAQTRLSNVQALEAEVKDISEIQFKEIFRTLKRDHSGLSVTEEDWEVLRPVFQGKEGPFLDQLRLGAEKALEKLGPNPAPSEIDAIEVKSDDKPVISNDADLADASLLDLRHEEKRLRALMGLDREKEEKLKAIEARATQRQRETAKLEAQIQDAENARERIQELVSRRFDSYQATFQAILDQESQLKMLYAPLQALVNESDGALGKLNFSVQRVVDVDAWADHGESLIDSRKGALRGKGSWSEIAKDELLEPWRTGSAAEAAQAIQEFRDRYAQEIMKISKLSPKNQFAFRKWGEDVSAWLNSLDHISVRYSVRYEGVDIRQLSPGTRGVVLLLLYLSLDQNDLRPLIIDQPEENLDPESVHKVLVPRFRDARIRRQVIIVTHNANLVVNTDADQVIVAQSLPSAEGQLPKFSYVSGGLENANIRGSVCRILEGGKEAFLERARRLQLDLK